MRTVVGVATGGLAVWTATPWVSMARRGTIDARTAAGWNAEDLVPAPRRAPDDLMVGVNGQFVVPADG